MVKKTIILLVLNFFCSFTLLVCGEKNILPNLTNSQEPESDFFPVRERSSAVIKHARWRLTPDTINIRNISSLNIFQN